MKQSVKSMMLIGLTLASVNDWRFLEAAARPSKRWAISGARSVTGMLRAINNDGWVQGKEDARGKSNLSSFADCLSGSLETTKAAMRARFRVRSAGNRGVQGAHSQIFVRTPESRKQRLAHSQL